ncbi:hypothetical protein [Pseudomonas sp. Pse1]|jgi:hypothetical protein|nr:hypothetical protein [Pseudomonas sp. Pse1]
MADKCQRSGLISVGERNELIVEATRHYANAVEAMAMDGESYADSARYVVSARVLESGLFCR